MPTSLSDCKPAARELQRIAQASGLDPQFHTAVILGSGLGSPGEIAVAHGGIAVNYADLPHVPMSNVTGHAGRVVIGSGELSGVLLFQGRVHSYEGHSLEKVTFVARMLAQLSVQRLIVTNAAGGIAAAFQPGDLMLINGHWSFANVQLRHGDARGHSGGRLWNPQLIEHAKSINTPLTLHSGVYAMMSGPCYETPAEVRMLQTLGVDAVGMSTIPESIVAAERGINVLGVSCITNVASGLSDAPLDHSEVAHVAGSIDDAFTTWLFELLRLLKSC